MKKTIIILFVFAVVLAVSIQAQAALQTIGTATYGASDYNLIYDDDLEITWLDYSNGINTWDSQVGWASGLNTGGVLTYNFNAGVSMNWSDDWRLPTVTDIGNDGCNLSYDGTDCGYNVDTSTGEMAHLFYTELGNLGVYDTSGNYVGDGNWGLTNTGDFQNLQSGVYWSGTEYSASPAYAWLFSTTSGSQVSGYKVNTRLGIAVRSGLAVVPEPMSMVLFMTGGIVLAGRMVVRRRRNLGL